MSLRQKNGLLMVPTPDGLEIGIAARRANTIDYSDESPRIRRREKELLGAHIGAPTRAILMLNQVHGDEIVDIETVPAGDPPTIADADGMITSLRDVCLVIRTADCVPVFVYDAARRVLGAAHSGWRGCRLDIAGKLVEHMVRRYGSCPGELDAFILPGIGPGSYTVNEDVASHFPGHLTWENGSIRLDLPGCILASLSRRGLSPDRILTAGRCTLEESDEFFSHRAGSSGRNLNFGLMPGNTG